MKAFQNEPHDTQEEYHTAAQAANCAKRRRLENPPDVDTVENRYDIVVGDLLFGLSSSDQPIRPEVIEAQACKASGGNVRRGYTGGMTHVRDAYMQRAFVADEGDHGHDILHRQGDTWGFLTYGVAFDKPTRMRNKRWRDRSSLVGCSLRLSHATLGRRHLSALCAGFTGSHGLRLAAEDMCLGVFVVIGRFDGVTRIGRHLASPRAP